MLINSSSFTDLPGITGASLSQSSDGPSTLRLSWRGYGPDWLRWMEPVTIMHRGRVLFHGRMTEFDRSNDAGGKETSATVTDALWLLDNLPLGAQVAEARAASETSGADMKKAGQMALESWNSLAKSCRVNAPLWTASDDGSPKASGTIWLDTARANFSTGAVYKRDSAITAWTALLEMKQANPDATFCLNPVTGAVQVIAIKNAERVVWDTSTMRIKSSSGISPQYQNCITGVALVVSWQGEDGKGGGSVLRVYPEDSVEPGDMGVKLFTAQVESRYQAERQASYMMAQLERYYRAVNMLQYSGSVVASMADVEASPLCQRMDVTGAGTHESWHAMRAMVTAVEWDFMDGTVEAQLGAQIDEPNISEMTFPDAEEDMSSDFSSDDGDDDGDDDFSSEEEPASYEDDSTTWDNTTTWASTTMESTTWESTTLESTTGEESTTLEDSTTLGDSTEEGTEPGSEPGSTPGSENPPTETRENTTTAANTTTGGGNTTTGGTRPGSEPGSEPGTAPGSEPGTTPATCDCGEKWKKNQEEHEDFERRLSALESATPGSNDGTGTEAGSQVPTCEPCQQKWEENKRKIEEIEGRLDKLESTGNGSDPGTNPGEGEMCSACAEKLKAYEERMAALEQKVQELQSGINSYASQLQSAINNALSASPALLGGNANQIVQQNANGTITVSASWSY